MNKKVFISILSLQFIVQHSLASILTTKDLFSTDLVKIYFSGADFFKKVDLKDKTELEIDNLYNFSVDIPYEKFEFYSKGLHNLEQQEIYFLEKNEVKKAILINAQFNNNDILIKEGDYYRSINKNSVVYKNIENIIKNKGILYGAKGKSNLNYSANITWKPKYIFNADQNIFRLFAEINNPYKVDLYAKQLDLVSENRNQEIRDYDLYAAKSMSYESAKITENASVDGTYMYSLQDKRIAANSKTQLPIKSFDVQFEKIYKLQSSVYLVNQNGNLQNFYRLKADDFLIGASLDILIQKNRYFSYVPQTAADQYFEVNFGDNSEIIYDKKVTLLSDEIYNVEYIIKNLSNEKVHIKAEENIAEDHYKLKDYLGYVLDGINLVADFNLEPKKSKKISYKIKRLS